MSANLSGKFRHRKINFTQVSNSALQNPNLSLKAKGLYSLIQSLNSKPNYDLYKWSLKKQCKEGEKAFNSAWKELKDNGYLKVYRIPSGDKNQFKYEYDLLDEADKDTPALINLNKNGEIANQKLTEQEEEKEENSHTPQNGVYGDLSDKSDKENIQTSHTPHFVPYAERTVCETHPVRKGGNIRNTESRNTELRNTYQVSQSKEDDGQTDEIREKIKEQIEYEYFEDNFPDDILGIDAIVNCMVYVLSNRSTKINGVLQSRGALEPYIEQVDSCTILEFIEHMRKKDLRGIKNISAYWRSAFINYIRESELLKLSV
jgi:hypothetical protein